MTKLNRKPRTVKGAVLIMVLTVMFVLIFLLAGTIAVVYSANNRVMQKYQESQAYYSARSVLDTYIYTFLYDDYNVLGHNGAGSGLTYHYINGSTVGDAPTMQSRSLELDLYDLAIDLDVSNADDTDGDGYSDPDTTMPSYMNRKNMPDWVKEYVIELCENFQGDPLKKWLDAGPNTTSNTYTCKINGGPDRTINMSEAHAAMENFIAAGGDNPTIFEKYMKFAEKAINPTQNSFDDTYNAGGVDLTPYSTFEPYYEQFQIQEGSKLADTVMYKVPSATVAGTAGNEANGFGNGRGKMMDSGAVEERGITGDAIITVKVLERKFHLGNGTTGTVDDTFKERFDAGSRERDFIKIQVISEIVYDGVPTSTSIIYKTLYSPTPGNDNALTSLGGINSSTNGFQIAGGMASLDPDQPLMLDATDHGDGISGTIFSEGSIWANTSGKVTLNEGASIVTKRDFVARNTMTVQATSDNSFIYIGGKYSQMAGFTVGNTSQKLSMLVGEFIGGDNGTTVYGNLYSDYLHVDQSNPGKVDVKGKIYTNDLVTREGNGWYVTVNQDGTAADGQPVYKIKPGDLGSEDVRISGKLVIKNYFGWSGGDPVEPLDRGWTTMDLILDVNDSDHVKFDNDNSTKSKISVCDPVNLDYYTGDHFNNTLTSDYKKVFTMPDGETFKVDTIQSRYKDYYIEDAFETTDTNRLGDFIDYFYKNDGSGDLDMSKVKGEDYIESAESRASRITGRTDTVLANATRINRNDTKITSGFYILGQGSNPNDGPAAEIDTTTGDVTIQLDAVGPGGNGTFVGNFVVTGTGKVTILVPGDGGTYGFGSGGGDFRLVYKSTMDAIEGAGNTIYSGADTGNGLTPPPEIDILVGGESTIQPYRGSFITGYVYGPRAKVNVTTGIQGQEFDYYESGHHSRSKFWLLGSVICGQYNNANVGIAYVGRNQESTEPGKKLFKWSDVLYTRGV